MGHFFYIYSKASLEASDSRSFIHVESKWIVLCFLWYIAEKIEASEYVVKVLRTEVLLVAEQFSNLIKLEAVLLFIFLRRVCIRLAALLGVIQIGSISAKCVLVCSSLP